MSKHLLSKSSFLKGLQCEKQLYLYKYHYDEMDDLSEMQKAIFQRGTDVGELAQQLFPGGTVATEGKPPDYDKGLKRTAELIREGAKVLYEASFRFNEVLAISDIIVRAEEGSSRQSDAKPEWNIYEVKSSTSISDAIINDAALQYYVLSNTGINIKDFFIIYINNQYVRQGELNLNELFVIESVLEQAKELQDFVEENVERLKEVLTKNHIPEIDIGEHCHTPYTCSFFDYCRKDLPEYSIFNFNGMHLNKKYELYNKGIIKLDDIPDDYPLNKNNKLQLEVYKSGEPLIDKEAVKEFLSTLNYPLYFMDFETFQPAVPLFDNTRPYQQIPFQYSIHYKENENGELKHFEFLADAGEDPRPGFITHLLKDTEQPGDIIVYNKTFEKTRLKEIAQDFPGYAEQIEERLSRIVDLMIPFQRKYYYTPEMKGSYSIKYVLPALVPELSYKNLKINEGGLASIAFESLQTETDLMRIAETRSQLLEYCKLDTLAMVKILDVLQNLIKEK